jgi:hypothetical protein
MTHKPTQEDSYLRDEYEALRSEILQKQTQAVSIFAGTIAAFGLVVGIAGGKYPVSSLEFALFISLLLLTLILVSALLVYALINSHTLIGSYIAVAHEEHASRGQWELAITSYRKRKYVLTPSRAMATGYFSMIILSLGFFLCLAMGAGATVQSWQIVILAIATMLTLWRVFCVYRIVAHHQKKVNLWREILPIHANPHNKS